MRGVESLVSVTQIVVVVVTFVVLAILGLTSRGGRLPAIAPVLVLRRFRVTEAPADGVLIDVSGRPKGLVAWILGLLRLDDETRLQVTATTFSVRRASLQGQNVTSIPLGQVGSTFCGFRKPLGFLAVGLFLAVSGLMTLLGGLAGATRESDPFTPRVSFTESVGGATIYLVAAAIFFGLYFLRKEMVIAVGDTTARVMGLTFKPSVVEGVPVDVNRLMRATELLNRKVLEAQLSPASVAGKIPAPAHTDAKATHRNAARPAPRCGGCGAALEPDSQFCGECGKAIE